MQSCIITSLFLAFSVYGMGQTQRSVTWQEDGNWVCKQAKGCKVPTFGEIAVHQPKPVAHRHPHCPNDADCYGDGDVSQRGAVVHKPKPVWKVNRDHNYASIISICDPSKESMACGDGEMYEHKFYPIRRVVIDADQLCSGPTDKNCIVLKFKDGSVLYRKETK